jgi:ketosteroid isomerase-like protein
LTAESTDPGRITEEDVATVRAGYERWNNGDLPGLSRLFAEDIVYQTAPEWPGQRVYRGASAVTSFLENEVAPTIGLRPVTIANMEPLGKELLIELQVTTRGFLSGLEMENMSLYHLALVEDGIVRRVRVYLDRKQAVRAAETGEA